MIIMVVGQELIELFIIIFGFALIAIVSIKVYSAMEERKEEIRQQGYTERQQIKAQAELRGIQIESNASQYGFEEPPEEQNQLAQLLPLLPMLGLPADKVQMIQAAMGGGGGDISSFLPLLAQMQNKGNPPATENK